MSAEMNTATVMSRTTFDNLSKPKSVNAKHFQYMTLAHWLIGTMKQTIDFTSDQMELMEKAMGLNSSAKEISAIYSEFANVQNDISKDVSKRLTESFHAQKKKATKPRKVVVKSSDSETDAKPKRKYTKKSDASDSESSDDKETSQQEVAEKPKRKYNKKTVVVCDVPTIIDDVVNTEVDSEEVVVAVNPVDENVSEPAAKPKKRVSKKKADKPIESVTESASETTEVVSETEVAPEPKKRVSKKKVVAKNPVTDTMIKTLNAFDDILSNLESEEVNIDPELEGESYN